MLIARGITGILAFLGIVTGIQLLPLSTACVIFYSYPVFAALFGFFIFREHVTGGQIFCIAALVLGMMVFLSLVLPGSILWGLP